MRVDLYIGPPGCGKTTKLSSLVREAVDEGESPLICSLTRTAAAEVAGRDLPVAQNAVGTLHSHAYAALDRPVLVAGRLADWNAQEPLYGFSGVRADVDDPYSEDSGRQTLGDQLMGGMDLLRAKMVDRSAWPTDIQAFAARWERWKEGEELLDFTDLIERAISDVHQAPGSPTAIYVDEAQDMSRLELELLRKWARSAGRLTIVGDPWQALYTWRGAAPDMFFSGKVADSHRYTLGQSYRVPRMAHGMAMKWIEQLSDYRSIDYAPRDWHGEIAQIDGTATRPEMVIDHVEELLERNKRVMICGSCSYLMDNTLAVLRKRGIPFSNPWRVRRGDWNPVRRGGRGVTTAQRLLDFLAWFCPPNEEDFNFGHNEGIGRDHWTFEELHRWTSCLRATGMIRRGLAKTLEATAKEHGKMQLRAGCLQQWFEDEAAAYLSRMLAGEISIEEALDWFEQRLSSAKHSSAMFPINVIRQRGADALRDTPRVYVGTIHSFKGAEADSVIVYPDLSVSGMREWFSGASRDGIVRMFYVAITRARESVFVARPVSSRSVPLGEFLN